MTIPKDRQVHFDLQIGRPDGTTFVSLAQYVTRCEIELGNVDQVGTGNSGADGVVRSMMFELINDGAIDSFHPRKKDSSWNQFGGDYTPLLFPMREVAAFLVITEPGVAPIASDFKELFRGYLGDSIRTTGRGSRITCDCRDLAKRLQNTYIERDSNGDVRLYPKSESTEPAEDVMQDILDDNGLSDVIIYTPSGTAGTPIDPTESPFFDINFEEDEPFGPEYVSVWGALQGIVAQFGWFLGYRYHEPTEQFQLVLMEPPRAKQPENIDLSDYATSATSGAFFWRGYRFKAEKDGFIKGLNCGYAGSGGIWHIGIYSTTADYVPDELLGVITFSEGTYKERFFNKAVKIEKGKNYIIAQGRESGAGTGTFLRVNQINVAGLEQDSEMVEIWEPNNGNCINYGCGGNENYIVGRTPTNPNDASRPRMGFVFSPAMILDWRDDFYAQDLDITDRDIRNAVTVNYIDKAASDAAGDFVRESVTAIDQDSIDTFGRRPMEIELSDTDLIDTEAEAERLAEAARDDLKDQQAIAIINMPILREVDVFSAIEIVNEPVSSTTDFFGVESVRHSLQFGTNPRFRTEAVSSGRITGGKQRWLKMQTRPGAKSPIKPINQTTLKKLSKPAGVVLGSGLRAITVTFDKPLNAYWDYTEIHINLQDNFTPTANTVIAKGRDLHFELTEAWDEVDSKKEKIIPGVEYYVQIIHYYTFGGKSDASDELSITAGGDISSSTFVIAASNTSARGKAGADFIGEGTEHQIVINQAVNLLTDDGQIVLLEGTYIIDGSIFLKDNIKIMGQGNSTVIKIKDGESIFRAIQNADTSGGNKNIKIESLRLEGNKDNGSIGSGVHFLKVDNTAINSVMAENFSSNGFLIEESNNILVGECCAINNNGAGIRIGGGEDIIISSSHFYDNSLTGVEIILSETFIVNGVIAKNNGQGLDISFSSEGEVLSSFFHNNLGAGIRLAQNNEEIKISNNFLMKNGQDIGNFTANILILPGSSDVYVSENTAKKDEENNCPAYGIFNEGTSGVIVNNILKNSGDTAAIRDDGTGTSFGISGNMVNNGDWIVGADYTP